MAMAETRRRFEPEFREGAVRIVRETGKSIAAVARDLGIKEGTLANWVAMDRHRREADNGGVNQDERAGVAPLPKEKAQRRVRGGVLKGNGAPLGLGSVGRVPRGGSSQVSGARTRPRRAG